MIHIAKEIKYSKIVTTGPIFSFEILIKIKMEMLLSSVNYKNTT